MPLRILSVLTLALTLAGSAVNAQSYPEKPIRLIVSTAAGGSTDIIGRLIGAKLGEALRQPVIIENRPGAGSLVAAKLAAQAVPDGYTLFLSGSFMATLSVFGVGSDFDPIQDFANVATLAELPVAIVAGNHAPFLTLQDLMAGAKRNPGKFSYGTGGLGSTAHLTCEILKFRTGIEIVHVPYKGTPITDMMGGHIPLACSNLANLPDLKGEKLRILATTGTVRHPSIPHVPTFRELGISGLDRGTWTAISAPSRTPATVIQRLNVEVARILTKPDVVERLRTIGAVPMVSTPEEFTQRLMRIRDDLADLKKSTNLKLD